MRRRSWVAMTVLVAGCGQAAAVSSSQPGESKVADETITDETEVSVDAASANDPTGLAAEQVTEKPAVPSAEDVKSLREFEATGPVQVSDLRFVSTVGIPSDMSLHPVGDAAFLHLSWELLLLEGNHIRRDEAFNQLSYDHLSHMNRVSIVGSWPDHVWMANSWWSDAGPSCGTVHRWQRYDRETTRGRWQPMAQESPGLSALAQWGDGAVAIGDGYGSMPEDQFVVGISSPGTTQRTYAACTDGVPRSLPLTPRVDNDELTVVGHHCRGEAEDTVRTVVVDSWRADLSHPLARRTLVEDEAWVHALLFRDGDHLLGLAERQDGGWKLALLDTPTPKLIGELPKGAIHVDAPGTDELWLIFARHLLLRAEGAWTAIPLSKELADAAADEYPEHQVWRRGPKDIWLLLGDRKHRLSHTGPISLGDGVSTLDMDEVIRADEERRERAERTACPDGWFVELYKLDPETMEADVDPADLMTRKQVFIQLRAVVKRFPSARPVEHDCCGEMCVGVTVAKRATASKVLEMLRRPASSDEMRWSDSMSLSCIPPWVSPLKL